ncbi:MAG: SPFH domain-containing protein [Proteobacteria bacterium]|nr:SPFH domain-containing protein [Pseudomonadota bacterium]
MNVKLAPPLKNNPLRGPLGAALAGVVLIGSAVLWFSFTKYVEPDEFAVRQVYLGPSKGIQKEISGPGMHLVIPGYERLHTFPRDMQVLDLNNGQGSSLVASGDGLTAPPIRIQTSEGYQVTVDVTVLYRVIDPYTLLTKVGTGRVYETKVVLRRSDKILRQTLGELNAEDFYSDTVRMQQAEDARQLLQEDLSEWGIQVWAVLVRDYTYDQRYQEAIEQRKIQDQTVFKNKAEAVAAEREAERQRVMAEGQAKVGVETQRGSSDVRKIAASADLYYRQRIAEGDLLVALAEAEGTRLENNALQVSGASNIVGIEMAQALDGTEVIIVSTTGAAAMNPLDLDALMEGW